MKMRLVCKEGTTGPEAEQALRNAGATSVYWVQALPDGRMEAKAEFPADYTPMATGAALRTFLGTARFGSASQLPG